MIKKFISIIGGSFLAAILFAGCATNDQEPPPENQNNNINTPGVNDNNGNNGVNDDLDRNNDIQNNNNDINTDNDGDMMKDQNDPGEEPIEDKRDRNDKDNVDR
ncbi:hypothetical protein KHA94_07875 [Bacillus sp. FJAT-49705]|uniref:Lipoprotein n=1 Tax=Cytobacillus citreus TaxID=2833586 RepID=A0ABS5NQM3_9BACI|nr:hypothetical protein [Cytobacillus citreus]MBS4190121.1 hypothetical protein [Cytobacillus citreus]